MLPLRTSSGALGLASDASPAQSAVLTARLHIVLNAPFNATVFHVLLATRGNCVRCLDGTRTGMAGAAWLYGLLASLWALTRAQPGPSPLFTSVGERFLPQDYTHNPVQLNYGVAVTDVDGDGDLEILVAGYNGPNLVLKYNRASGRLENVALDDKSSPFYALRDRQGNAIGVAACDIDGDGREEIYFLNTNNAYSGMATYSDKLFKFRNGRWEDILSDPVNVQRGVASRFAGRSVACIDRKGTGRYSVYVANYAKDGVGPHAVIEMDEAASDVARGIVILSEVAKEAGVNKFTGGRGVTVGPIINTNISDIFCDNEHGPNFLFKNNGDGTFTDVATATGVADADCHGRGVALADFNKDGRVDIVYGNWNGPHRLFLQSETNGIIQFRNVATKDFATPSAIRTVIAADFDNDQELEVFFNNIAYNDNAPNRVFRVSGRAGKDPFIEELDVGEAKESWGRGTGGVATDFDGDGTLELILSHGESMAQALSIYKVTQSTGNGWLRVVPRTRFGAFARGAKVVLYTAQSGPQLRVIDGGSGYLCQMEPVAHFGLENDVGLRVEVTWPDGYFFSRNLRRDEMNSLIEIPYPDGESQQDSESKPQCGEGFTLNDNGRCVDVDECSSAQQPCPSTRPLCANTFGSFSCKPDLSCQGGFEPDQQGSACVDLNWCSRDMEPWPKETMKHFPSF
uniref:Cartilage acidic protein 1 isoform X2 n=2 Tax=Petromyzon marinus TaxID=7757 RepID=A0AAJ7T1F9_PETMA|nr:cartilage acidic protein 1 isoform X2 [Petromyzon marinus]